ncbi:MAG TPA: hypothetical protein VJA85_07285 [Candidatus Limnocylindria bacterium]|nr:hypothetical protein [Candidatus Limnocylindria bacterium]
MIIKTERRSGIDRRSGGDPFAPERRTGDRRTMCWEVENCDLTIRYRCPAFILRRPCWELWAVEGIGPARACCHNEIDCEPGRCAIAEKRFAGTTQELTVHVGRRGQPLGIPRQRRHACPHFYVTTPTRQRVGTDAPQLLRSLLRQEGVTNRCQLRGGVHLDSGYVADLCLTGQYHDCVFYEDQGD